MAWKFKINQIILPPKKFIGNLNPEHIEKRRVCLEAYLQDIVNQLGKIPRLLQIFLEFDIYVSKCSVLKNNILSDGILMFTAVIC